MRGWIHRVAWVVGCGLVGAFGLISTAGAVDDQGEAFEKCVESTALYVSQHPDHHICADCYLQQGTPAAGTYSAKLQGPFGGCQNYGSYAFAGACTERGTLHPTYGFLSKPGGTCEDGCEWEFQPDPIDEITIGNLPTRYYGTVQPNGETCSVGGGGGGEPTPETGEGDPCKDGLCAKPDPPSVCGKNGELCVEVPDMPDCASDDTSALCAGKGEPPEAPEPPPPPDPPIGPDIQPLSPPPPLVTMCSGPSCINITINEYNNNGDGPGGGDGGGADDGDGDGDGDDDGQGINLCPDGSRPVDGRCGASNTPCPDGTSPSQGTCVADPRVCADGVAPVGGVCGGNGECEGGGQPQNGHCGWTCPDGSHPISGRCEAGWAPCQDGTQPVNGQCGAGECNPEIDENQCGHGQAQGGETCGTPPSCYGDQIACATLFQNWKTRCNLEAPEGEPGEGLEDLPGPEGVWDSGAVEPDPGWMDTSGYGLPRTCPQVPSIEVMGTTVSFPPVWCELLATMGTLLIIGVSYQAAKIAGGA